MKRHGSILNLVLITFVILFSFSCNRDCHKDGTCAPDYRKFPLGEAKDYLWSLPGSYWIYKNTSTGDLDTQTCTGFVCDTIIRSGTEDYSEHITVEYERIRRTIKSSFNKWIYYDESRFYSPDAVRPLKASIDRSASGPGLITPFFHPFVLDDHDGNGSSRTTCKGMDSTMTIQGKTYTNVAKFDIDLDQIDEKDCQYIPVTTYYWAKDVGLIKKTIKNCNYSWELIEYNIIK